MGIPYTVVHDFDITEVGNNGERRSSSTLQAALTINFKLEALGQERNNRESELQQTFEAEMPQKHYSGQSNLPESVKYVA